MEIIDINPFVRYCGVLVKSPLLSRGIMAYDCRLFYIMSGQGTANIAGNTVDYSENTLLLIREGTYYHFEQSKQWMQTIVVNFDLDMSNKDRVTPITPAPKEYYEAQKMFKSSECDFFSSYIVTHNCYGFKETLMEILDNYLTSEPMHAQRNSALLKVVLTDIFCRKALGDENYPAPIKHMMSLAKKHYSEDLDAAYLEAKLGYNAQYLNRLFKEYVGTTFHKYLIGVRVDEAKKCLLKTTDTAEVISKKCGFVNASHFCSAFKKHTGMSPGTFKESSKSILG